MSIHQTAWGTQGEQRSFTESSQALVLPYVYLSQCFTKQVVELLSLACILVSENTGLLENKQTKNQTKKTTGKTFKGKVLLGFWIGFLFKNH